MTFAVVISRRAERDIYRAVAWWAEHRSAEQASRWLTAIHQRIKTLKDEAVVERSIVASESPELPREVLELHFGLGRHATYRILFTVHRDLIMIVAVRHLMQDQLTADDLA